MSGTVCKSSSYLGISYSIIQENDTWNTTFDNGSHIINYSFKAKDADGAEKMAIDLIERGIVSMNPKQ